MAEDEVKALADAKKLALPDRVAHSNWKARSAAYEDIAAACKGIYDEADPSLSDYGVLFVKSVADSNAAAQDKALEALINFLSKASEQHVNRYAEKTCSNIVAKALNGRSSTVQRATEALLMFIELEQSSAVVEALLQDGLKHKVPKVVLASVDVLELAVSKFGLKLIAPQPIIKALPDVLESKDGKVRDKAKTLVVELSRWLGADLIRSTVLKNARGAIKDELELAMQEVAKLGRPVPERVTRKEQARLAALQAQQIDKPDSAADPAAEAGTEVDAAAAVEVEIPAETDPYDVVEPKDVLKELKKEFWDGLESKKWNDRKAALTQLREAASYPRLASGRDVDYGDVNRELRKVITKDSNVVCVAEAVSCTAALAQGLRSAYSATAKNWVEVLVEKFKEKNASVGKAVRDALSVMHKHCWGLLDVAETVAAALAHVSPKVKEDCLGWLREACTQEAKPALSKLAPLLLAPAAKCAEDALPSMREAAMGFMVAFAMKFGNPAVLEKFTAKLDDGKKKRLEEMMAEARGGPPPTATSNSGSAAASSARVSASNGPASPTSPSRSSSISARGPSAAAAALAATRSSAGGKAPATRSSLAGSSTAATSASAKAVPGKATGTAGGKKAASANAEAEDEASLASGSLSRDEAIAAMTDMFGADIVKGLQDAVWKPRLDNMELVMTKVQEGDLYPQCSALVQGMSYLPGWDEKNFQVLAKQFEVVRVLAANAPGFSKRDAFVAINGVIDKMSDIKLKGPGCELLSVTSEAVGPMFVANILHKKAAVHKNPKVLSEMHNWLAVAIVDFGLACFNVKSVLDWAKEDLQSANAGVRNSVIQMLGAMHRFLGPPLADMIRADVKPALMAAIDGEFAKNPKDTTLMPTRVSKPDAAKRAGNGTAGSKGGATSNGNTQGGAAVSMPDADELIPRADLSAQLSGGLITQMGSAQWKERKEAMDAVEGLIANAGGRIQPQLGDLVPALRARMADTNRNLAAQALLLTARLARAMGRPADRALRGILSAALKNLSDNKNNVRAAVTELLTAWAASSSTESLLPELVDALTSPKSTADGRTEALSWLASTVPGGKLADQLPDVCRCLSAGVVDKAAEVREAAGRLLTALLQDHTPAQLNQAAASCLEGAGRKAVADAIAKQAGGNGAAVPPLNLPSSASGTRASLTARSSTGGPASRPPSSGGTASARTSQARAPAGGLRSSLSLNRPASRGGSVAGSIKGDADDGPLLLPDTKKDDRARKGKFRPAKLEVRPDEASTLEGELGPLTSSHLRGLLFAKDFKRHCEAADTLRGELPVLYTEVLGVLDLLFRWCTLRIMESNTQVLVKVLELLKELMARLEAEGYQMSEFEAKLILPVLVEKAGHNQDKLRADHKLLLQRASQVHPPVRVAAFIKDGLESKNNRTRVVCAEELGLLIDRYGPAIYTSPATAVKSGASSDGLLAVLARLVMERDNALRSAALGCLEAAYAYEGVDGLWRLLGSKLPDAARTLVEERLKYADRDLANRGLRPGYKSSGSDDMLAASTDYLPGMQSGVPSGRPQTAGGVMQSPRRPSPSGRAFGTLPSPAGSRPSWGQSPSGRVAAGSVASPANRVSASASFGANRGAAGVPHSHSNSSILAGVPKTSGVPSPTGQGAGLPERRSAGLPPSAGVRSSIDASHAGGSYGGAQHSAATGMNGANTLDASTLQYLRASSAAFTSGSLRADSTDGSTVNMSSMSKDSDAEFKRDFKRCFNEVQFGNTDESVAAMKLLCYEMMEMGQHSALVLPVFREHATPLVTCLTSKLEQAFADAGEAAAHREPINSRPCKYTLNMLMSIFSTPSIAKAVEEDVLQGMLSVLLLCLVDERLAGVPEGMALLKALNLLMMKILENCNRTHVFCCLITLLLVMHPATQLRGPADKMEYAWCDLVVKCLIKMTKMLTTTIEEVDLRQVLLAIHTFFDTLGPEEIRRRGALEDKPLRMVKTVLHEVCKLQGASIYQFTDELPGANLDPSLKPIIFAYIDLNLQTVGAKRPNPVPAAAAAPPPQAPAPAATSSPPEAGSTRPAPTAPRVPSISIPSISVPPMSAVPPNQPQPADGNSSGSGGGAEFSARSSSGEYPLQPSSEEYCTRAADDQAARTILHIIFKRIAEHPKERNQALADLHFFSLANPETGVDVVLNNASATFRNFIQKHLQQVRRHLSNQAQQGHGGQPAYNGVDTGRVLPQGSPDAEVAVTASYPSAGGSAKSSAGGVGDGPAVAGLKLGTLTGFSSGGGAGSGYNPSSPLGGGKNTARNAPVVGEDKIAELRDRMARMQMDVSALPARSSAGNNIAFPPTTSDPGVNPAAAATAAATVSAAPMRNTTSLTNSSSSLGNGSSSLAAALPASTSAIEDWVNAAANSAGVGGMAKFTSTIDTSSSLAGLQERMRRLRQLDM